MKRYEIRDKEQHRGWISMNPWDKYTYTFRIYGSKTGYSDWEGYDSLGGAEQDGWIIPKRIKRKLVAPIIAARTGIITGLLAIALVLFGLIAGLVVVVCCGWDYRTGQDTGYISAVDKMTLTDDYKIYLRRRPLDAQGFTTAETDEIVYCTTADRKEVVDEAYKAIVSGKRVILIYDTPRPFGWKKIGGCNSAPITDIKVVEEKNHEYRNS